MEDSIEIIDNSGMDTYSEISILPREILSRIFAILPLADRKSVRLVSRVWYDSSISAGITKHEKLVIRPNFSIEDVNEVMLRSNYPLMHLEFQGLPICDLSVDFWRVCGQRIRSLKYLNCQWYDKIFSDIVLHCENLTSFLLKMRPGTIDWPRALLPILVHSERLLDDLIQNGVRRPKLRTFFISMDDFQLPESVLRKILILYPRIERFRTASTFSFVGTFTFSLMSHFVESPPVFSELYQCLKSASQDILGPTNLTWMETLTEKAEQGLRLKQLSSVLFFGRREKYIILDFFKSQRNLEVIRFMPTIVDDDDDERIKGLFFHILESCPNLKEYRFRPSPRKLVFAPKELPRFLTSISKLEFLSLNVSVLSKPVPAYHDLLSNSVHLNLTTLDWRSCDIDSDFFHAFIQRCSSLRHLRLLSCCDTMLQTIFQYLVELRTLVLTDGRGCKDSGFTGHDVNGEEKGYSIKRLQQLKYLQLHGFPDVLMDKVALELHSPRLEFLSIDKGFHLQLSEEDSSHLASRLSELRVLTIKRVYDDEYSVEKTVQFCKRFKYLQRLIFRQSSDNTYVRLYTSLFNACPRLLYISNYPYSTSFLRNPFTGNVIREPSTNLNFSGSIFGDGYSALCSLF